MVETPRRVEFEGSAPRFVRRSLCQTVIAARTRSFQSPPRVLNSGLTDRIDESVVWIAGVFNVICHPPGRSDPGRERSRRCFKGLHMSSRARERMDLSRRRREGNGSPASARRRMNGEGPRGHGAAPARPICQARASPRLCFEGSVARSKNVAAEPCNAGRPASELEE